MPSAVLLLACECIPQSHPASPRYVCVCVSVVNSSHISKVWSWEGVCYLLCDTNYLMQFWCLSISVFPFLIPLPLYICVSDCVYHKKKKKKKKIGRYFVLSGRPTSVRCDIEKGFITCFVILTTTCSFSVEVWVHSLVSSPFPYTYVCLCVITKKKKKKKEKKRKILCVVRSSHIGNVWNWEGVYHFLCDTNCSK